ncbi:MAG: Polymorphic outer membrane protein [Candidatus Uhrbacteria bacterium GW2011_GWE2_46_68]|uniref:Polymorphic outer membrane protein n=2 Tax=Candidatus Uhriibacteriota TaxID=1752732 RepID=A0A0G1T5G0_9BACT|nr:MAG: Polymorphic outer membrane protein [Candidatus Uhrbacteria bacterium GW2011_GWF2_46_218]KKU40615.1 MAG: Polymorphic outer membrane protein [Candidatus Uhrbacteria bacterium GW2011_GWE2_46_68]
MVGIGCIIAAVILVRSWQSSDSTQILLDAVTASLESCDDAVNPDDCRQQIVETQANATGEAVVCDVLTGDVRDQCLWSVARKRLDPEFCEGIAEATSNSMCWDEMHQRLATKNKDTVYCEQMRDEQKVIACERAITEKLITTENCEEYHTQEICGDRLTTETAVAARNPDVCAVITHALRLEGCLEAVGIGDRDMDGVDEEIERVRGTSDVDKDTDDDGLGDFEEIFDYKTDPLNTDSDEDGYTDGQEVAGGYNPLGTGKL